MSTNNFKFVIFHTVSGALSGFIAVTSIYPFDVMRKRMQLNGMQNEHQYDGIRDMIGKLYKE